MQGNVLGYDYFETSDGAVCIWIEQGSSIHIKAITKENDPVELSESDALEIAEFLIQLSGRV